MFKYDPPKLQNVDGLTSTITSKIGGMMGLGGDIVNTDVTFERNQYYGGDKVTVKVVCDNSKCSTAVKSFKLKFKRKVFMLGERITVQGDRIQLLNKQSKYLYAHKDTDHGCGAKKKVERELTMDIPQIDPDFAKMNNQNLKEHETKMMEQMQASCNGAIFSVQYSLKVFVRHDSKQQFGEGACVTFPIKILERPVEYVPS